MAENTTPVVPKVAELDEEWTTGTGPKAKPSIFEDHVRQAAENIGKAYITPITDDLTDRYIVNQLHKAGKALNVKVQTRVFEYKGRPAVKFRVVEPREETSAESPTE